MLDTGKRRTLQDSITFEGRGIHANQPAQLTISPASSSEGLLLRMAGRDWPPLAAAATYAVAEECERRTVLRGPEGQLFQQLEHVMAALASCGITDAVLEQEGPEPPFLDGGAARYTEGIIETGWTDLNGRSPEALVINRPFALTDGNAHLVATPHDGLRLSCYVDFPGTPVGSQGFSLELNQPSDFLTEAAPARTFALERDLDALRKAGLGRGGTLENAVVFNGERYLNEALYFEDEVTRHKVIDLLGDLALIGRPLRGHFWAWRAGHRSHVKFAQALMKEFDR